MRLAIVRLHAAAALLALALPAHAHRPSDAFVSLDLSGAALSGSFAIALRDLATLLPIDTNGDDALTWGELRRSRAALERLAGEALAISSAGSPCTVAVTQLLVDERLDGPYAHLVLGGRCPGKPAALDVRYQLLFDLDPTHRGILVLRANGIAHSAVLSPARDTASLALDRAGRSRQFADYFHEGVHHIWAGADHLLFLVALLLPSVLVRDGGRWLAGTRARSAVTDVVRIVTAFTIAHSVTLTASALDVVRIPSALAESAIALSVVLAALNNIRPVVDRSRWLVAFGFGLVHGFGFASALAQLGLPDSGRLLSLLAFNLGVEAGQLAVVLVLLPLVWSARRTAAYGATVVFGSLAVALVGAIWLFERATGLVT